jgi:hypothetical protein
MDWQNAEAGSKLKAADYIDRILKGEKAGCPGTHAAAGIGGVSALRSGSLEIITRPVNG